MFVALDFETTGLLNSSTDDPAAQPSIVEIGACKSDSVDYKFESLVKPDAIFQPGAQEISGITDEDLNDAPLFCEVIRELSLFVVGCDTIITYNGTGFDLPLLSYQLKRNKLETTFPWPPIHLDIMIIGKDIMDMPGKGGPKSPKLTELYSWLFKKDFTAHRALPDAIATFECAIELRDRGFIKL